MPANKLQRVAAFKVLFFLDLVDILLLQKTIGTLFALFRSLCEQM